MPTRLAEIAAVLAIVLSLVALTRAPRRHPVAACAGAAR